MYGLYTVNTYGGCNFARLATSFYGTYRWSKSSFGILRHYIFTGKRPQLIPWKWWNKPHPNVHIPINFYILIEDIVWFMQTCEIETITSNESFFLSYTQVIFLMQVRNLCSIIFFSMFGPAQLFWSILSVGPHQATSWV